MLLAILLCGCQARRHPLVAIDALQIPKKIHVRSHAFTQGGRIPMANSAYGDNVSPDLEWSGVPASAKSLVLLVQDPDTPNGLFTHWILYQIPPSARGLPAGLRAKVGTLKQGIQGQNDAGELGYYGPHPPDAPPHHYHFQLFALKSGIRQRPGYDTPSIYVILQKQAICGGDLVGVFQKP